MKKPGDDEQVARAFEEIAKQTSGKLDILVRLGWSESPGEVRMILDLCLFYEIWKTWNMKKDIINV